MDSDQVADSQLHQSLGKCKLKPQEDATLHPEGVSCRGGITTEEETDRSGPSDATDGEAEWGSGLGKEFSRCQKPSTENNQ